MNTQKRCNFYQFPQQRLETLRFFSLPAQKEKNRKKQMLIFFARACFSIAGALLVLPIGGAVLIPIGGLIGYVTGFIVEKTMHIKPFIK